LPVAVKVIAPVAELFAAMHQDIYALVAKNDRIIAEYTRHKYQEVGQDKDKVKRISGKARQLARFLCCMREETKNPDLTTADYATPDYFKAILQSLRKMSEYEEKTNNFGKPPVAQKLGAKIKQCIQPCITQALLNRNERSKLEAKDLMYLLDKNFNTEISKRALSVQRETKRNKPKEIPKSEDILKLANALKTQLKSSSEALEKEDNIIEAWKMRNKVLLATEGGLAKCPRCF